MLAVARGLDLTLDPGVVVAHRRRHLAQIAATRRGNDARTLARNPRRRRLQSAAPVAEAPLPQEVEQVTVERGDAIVVELGGDGAEDRHLLGRPVEGLAVAHELLSHVAQRVVGAVAVELVDRDDVGEVEHVDLLELARRAELRRHDIDRGVDQRHDRGVALADTGGFHQHEVEPGQLAGGDDLAEIAGDLALRPARRQRAHVDARARDRVHADAVAQQRAAAAPPRRIDREDGDGDVRPVGAEAAHDFVAEGRLAGAAGAGHADHRNPGDGGATRGDGAEQAMADGAGLDAGDQARQGVAVARGHAVQHARRGARGIDVNAVQHVVDHAPEAELLAVLGRIDAGHAIGFELADLARDDHAAAAAEHPHMPPAALAQQVDHVFEVLEMAALVGAHGDGVGVFLDRGADDLLDRAVVAEMDDLGAGALQHAANDVDRGVVTVVEAGRGHEPRRTRDARLGAAPGRVHVKRRFRQFPFPPGTRAVRRSDGQLSRYFRALPTLPRRQGKPSADGFRAGSGRRRNSGYKLARSGVLEAAGACPAPGSEQRR